MTTDRTRWIQRYGGLVGIGLAAVAFYVLNLLSPEFHDDFIYKFIIAGGEVDYSRPVSSIADVWRSQVDHYFTVNGRSPVHFLVQVFTGLTGKSVFNVFNTLVFALFIWLLQRGISRHRRSIACWAVVVTLWLVVLLPLFKDTFLWMTGSVNYLWSATAVLLFFKAWEAGRTTPMKGNAVWMLPLALLAGWTHEGISLPLALALTCIQLFRFRKTRGTRGFWLTMAFLVGACVAAFAPGNLARAASDSGWSTSSFGLKVISGFTVLAHLKIVYIAILMTLWALFRHRQTARQVLADNAHLLLAALLSLGVIFAAGFTSTRTAFGLELFALVYLLRLIGAFAPKLSARAVAWSGIILSALLILGYCLVLRHTVATVQETECLIAQMEQNEDGFIGTSEHDAGIFEPYVRTLISRDAARNAINFDPHSWPASMAATYHRDSLVFLPQAFLDDLIADSARYDALHLDTPYEFYVVRIDNRAAIREVRFELEPADFENLPFYFRPIARRMNRYTHTSVTTDKWATITPRGTRYLLIKRDHDLDTRLKGISIK